jgi:LuxR family maltose regulon positive regulatory protein
LTGKLSRELVYRRPWLCIYEAESNLWFGQLDEAEELLAAAEKHLRAEAPDPDTQAMRGHHAYVNSRVTAMRGDVRRAIELGHLARENTPASNLALQLNIGVLLGYVYFLAGDFPNACQTLVETIQSAPAARDVIVATRCVLARLYAVQGLLNNSHDLYQKAAQSIREAGGQQLGAMSIVNVGIADVLYEWNDLEAALTHMIQGLESIQYWGKADDIALAYTTLARIQQAQGNLPAALETIKKGSQVIQTRRVFSEAREAVVTAEIRLRLAQGDHLAVSRLTRSLEERLSSGDPFRFENELAHITLARAYLAQKNPEECFELLSRLAGNAQTGGRTGRLIQILILKALAMQKLGDPGQALAILEKSLVLAEPEGYIRTFVDEGQPVQMLLTQWLAQSRTGPLRDYAVHLLSQFDAKPHSLRAAQEEASSTGELAEPVSQRELEVLQLIALGKTNPEIARQLVVTVGTVKAHTASIYRKLDVANRTEAVARARQLGIIP